MAVKSYALPEVVRFLCDQMDRSIVTAAIDPDEVHRYGLKLFSDIQTHCQKRIAELSSGNDPLDRRVCAAIGTFYGIPPEEIMGRAKRFPAPIARQLLALIILQITMSERRASEITGLCRTTIRYQAREARNLLETNESARTCFTTLKRILQPNNQPR